MLSGIFSFTTWHKEFSLEVALNPVWQIFLKPYKEGNSTWKQLSVENEVSLVTGIWRSMSIHITEWDMFLCVLH